MTDTNASEPPITLATTSERMEQLRRLRDAGLLRADELQLLADYYLAEPGGGLTA